MGNRGLVRAKWTLGIAAACVAALGLFSCSSGDVTGISALSAAYDIIYEFDTRTCCDSIDNDGDGGTDEDDEDYCMDTCRDTDGNGICEGGEPTPCPAPGPGELRLELAHFDGAVARFALRAYDFSTIDPVWRVRFRLTFNGDLLGYTYPSPGVGSHDPAYPGAVPWKKLPPSLRPDPIVQGLADGNCNGCCIEWTDYSCFGAPEKKGETCFKDINPNDVNLCIKRSCTPSQPPSSNGSCTSEDRGLGSVDCCCCTDVNPLFRHCRRTDSVPALCSGGAKCPYGGTDSCHNTCDRPLFTEREIPVAGKQAKICCTEEADVQIEDADCEEHGGEFLGVAPEGVVATIPLRVKAAREFDDFRFFFEAGVSATYGYGSDFKLTTLFTTGEGTVIATK